MQAISSDLSILILPPFPGSPILTFLFIVLFLFTYQISSDRRTGWEAEIWTSESYPIITYLNNELLFPPPSLFTVLRTEYAP